MCGKLNLFLITLRLIELIRKYKVLKTRFKFNSDKKIDKYFDKQACLGYKKYLSHIFLNKIFLKFFMKKN